jgi:hypothetical protein
MSAYLMLIKLYKIPIETGLSGQLHIFVEHLNTPGFRVLYSELRVITYFATH